MYETLAEGLGYVNLIKTLQSINPSELSLFQDKHMQKVLGT